MGLHKRFCGNPHNHEPHKHEKTVMVSGFQELISFWCDGVEREETKEVIVEKFDPTLTEDKAEDATRYSKVTIMIEEEDGSVCVITAKRASDIRLDYAATSLDPRREYKLLERGPAAVSFHFQPYFTGMANGNLEVVSIEKYPREDRD